MIKKYIENLSLLEWALFIAIVSYNAPWFIWGYSLEPYIQYSSVLIVALIFYKNNRLKGNKAFLMSLVLIFYFVILQVFNGIHLSYILIAFSYFLSNRISAIEGTGVLKKLTNYLYLSVIIPLPLWLIHQFVMPLPIYDYIDIGAMKVGDAGGVIMENYIFFVSYEGFDALRFYSWYDEPGTLGTLAAFVLFANRYNFRDKKIFIIFIGCLFTFSLAYYILTLVGWLFYSLKSIKKLLISLLSLLVICFSFYHLLKDNLAFQGSVIERIINFGDHGIEHRNSDEKTKLWSEASASGHLIFGLGSGALDNYGGISTSYKSFILEFGYVGVLLVMVSYLKIIKKKNKESYCTFFLFFLSFLQRPQLFEVSNIVLFSCIVMSFIYDINLNTNNEFA